MSRYIILFLFILVGYCESAHKFITTEKLDKNLQVVTTTGVIQGRKAVTFDGFPYFSYQGIPYAQPPIKNLRFKPPIASKPWKGVLDATKEQSGCIEVVGTLNKIFASGQENCLYLNIFTPKNSQSSQELLPVLVWIHGGGFTFGNSSTIFYGPDKLVKQDIIIVTFNYRLGILGFLSTEDVSSPGNYGLKDQNLVLQWVQQNIQNFGGNKNRVTLSGQSAGAAMVMYHMISPTSKGLFHKAIALSGSPLCSWALKRSPRTVALDVGLAIGIKTKTTKDLIAQIRKVDTKELQRVTYLLLVAGIPQIFTNGFPFAPVIEPPHKEAFLTENALELFTKGTFHRVPIMLGFTEDETMIFSEIFKPMLPFVSIFDISPGLIPNPYMNIRTSDERREAGLKIKQHYLGNSGYLDTNATHIFEQFSDDIFIRPIIRTIEIIYKYAPVYNYLFSHTSEFGLKLLPFLTKRISQETTHHEDVFFIWDWSYNNASRPTNDDEIVSQKMLRLWKNFITTGNPTPTRDNLLDNILWPAVEFRHNITYLNINTKFSLRQNFREKHIQFWENLYKQYGHPPYTTL